MLRLLLGPGAIGYDASWSIAWGDALAHLHAPDHGPPYAPTPHPLANVLGLVASLFGDAAPEVLLGVSFVALGALGVAAFEAGRRSFGTVAGIVFAAILLTRPFVVEETLMASIDVPFLALVIAALAVEVGETRRATTVLVLLALAGLLRPEAWPLAAAYAVHVRTPRAFALAAAAPVLWCLGDLALFGDPLFSFHGTRDLAGVLDRERGLGAIPGFLPASLEAILRPGVMWTGLAVGAVALVVAQERILVPLAVLALGILGFLVLGVSDLPLILRYLLVPAAMLALFCAAGVSRHAWLPVRIAVAAVLLAAAPAARDAIRDRIDTAAYGRELDADLLRAADRADASCRPFRTSTNRSIAPLAFRLGVRPSDVELAPPIAPRGLLFAARAEVVVADVGFDVSRPAEDVRPPAAYDVVAAGEWWTLGARC
ncbi:MAG TPA: hypothetical protein VF549_11325 [Solirubrobacteraceae bacterium]